MATDHPKYSRTLAKTRSLWIATALAVFGMAVLLAYLVETPLEVSVACALALGAGLLLWRVFRQLDEAARDFEAKDEQMRFVFDSVPIGLYWSDHREGENPVVEDRIFNPAHSRLTGLSKEEMDVPGAFASVTHPDDFERQKKVRKRLLEGTRNEVSMEKRYLHPDGKVVWVAITWIRRWNESMTRFQEISTLVDITDQKRTAAALEQARSEAEDASRSKSLFLASMSHEIRTPMNGMIGMLHILESYLDKENLKYLEIAQNSANDLLALINDILDFSKIEAGKMEIERSEVALDELLERAGEIHANNAFEKGLDLRVALEPGAAISFRTDPHKLRQVLSNLLSNAIKFTEHGEVVIGARRIGGEERLEIFVEDTGIGLGRDSRERLFQAFTQENASTTRKYGGTGLGLSICKSIVEHLGGEIGVESDEGRGSRFWIQFPLERFEPLDDLSGPLPQDARSESMVVDRSTGTVNCVKAWLQHWGCPTRTARSLAEAKKVLLSGKPVARLYLDASVYAANEKGWDELIREEVLLAGARVTLLERLAVDELRELPSWVARKLSKPLRIRQLFESICIQKEDSVAVEKAADADDGEACDFGEAKILVVEDNITNRTIVTKLLMLKHGIEADTAENGLIALNLIRENRYDVVLMDCMMPEMDGYEATRAIRSGLAGEDNRTVPVVALTANAMEEDQKECEAAGMDDHMSKPVSLGALEAKLRQWVGSRSG